MVFSMCILQTMFQAISLHICYKQQWTKSYFESVWYCQHQQSELSEFFSKYAIIEEIHRQIFWHWETTKDIWILVRKKLLFRKFVFFVKWPVFNQKKIQWFNDVVSHPPHHRIGTGSNILEQWDYLNSRQIEHLLIT